MNVKFKSPVDVQIEITEKCNHRCRHCYNFFSNTADFCNKKLTVDEMEIISQKLIENDVVSVTITGGEPFLNYDVLIYAIERFYNAGIYVSINTNLTVLPESAIEKLKSFSYIKILTTLFSYKPETHNYICGDPNGYNKTIKNIKDLVSAGINVSANMVLCKENIEDVYLTGKLAYELGCKAFCGTRVSAPIWNKDFKSSISNEELSNSIDVLLKVEEDFGIGIDVLGCYPKCAILTASNYHFFGRRCMAGKTTVTVGSNGGVRPCSHSSTEYGNIFEEDLITIWDKMSDWRNDSFIPEKCKSCKIFNLCSGGCRADAEARGNICAMDINAKPENVALYESPSVQNKRSFLFDDDQKFIINPDIRFRKENFGGIIYIKNTTNLITINKLAFEYLENYNKNRPIDYNAFLLASKADQNNVVFVKKLFNLLVKKSFLIDLV